MKIQFNFRQQINKTSAWLAALSAMAMNKNQQARKAEILQEDCQGLSSGHSGQGHHLIQPWEKKEQKKRERIHFLSRKR